MMTTSNEHNNAPAVPQDMRLVPVSLLQELESSMHALGHGLDFTSVDTGRYNRLREVIAATPAPAPAQEVGLADDERVRCLIASGCIGTVKMTYDSGPYEITRTSINASRLIDAIIAALRAKGGK